MNFVLQTSLREVRDLRLNPDVHAFRTTFLPWLEKLESGEEGACRVGRAPRSRILRRGRRD
jgi:hypothetical protein